ncbi:MAG: hypothetical protein J6K31_11815 [Parabacteroides sp.]|nr:hypothetical protein [Parabacteroides sp.]
MNEKTRTIIFNISALLLLAGAGLYLALPVAAPYLFAVGAAGIAISYLTMSTREMDFRKRRLHRYNILAGLLCIFASALMFSGRKEWVICLTISALLQLYTAFMAPRE